jgi:hypothetical protein
VAARGGSARQGSHRVSQVCPGSDQFDQLGAVFGWEVAADVCGEGVGVLTVDGPGSGDHADCPIDQLLNLSGRAWCFFHLRLSTDGSQSLYIYLYYLPSTTLHYNYRAIPFR